MPQPFVLFGERTPSVRLFTIGPEHLDWLCAFCGKTGNLDGDRLSRWALVLDQINIGRAVDEWDDFQDRIDRIGWETAQRRCCRSAIDHLQQHLRFEKICLSAGPVPTVADQWPFDDDPPDPL